MTGRPPLWKTKEDLEKSLDGFFEWCESNSYIPDVEGMAVYLDCSRETICQYEKLEEFSDTIKKVKNKIAFHKKQGAMSGKINPTVFVFDFKNNHHYNDKTEVDNNINLGDKLKKVLIEFEE